MTTTQTMNFVADAAGAAAMLAPLRQQLLEHLREPDSASGLARRLNIARQKINYHLRELEKHGFVEEVEMRRKGNCMERIVRATARYYLISPQALGNLASDPSQIQDQDRFSSTYLAAVASRAISDLAVLRSRAEKAGKRLPTFTLETKVKLASAAQLHDFVEDLSNAVARLVAKYHNEKAAGGRVFKFIIGSYPTITKQREEK